MIDYLVDTPDGSAGILDGWERNEQGRPLTLIVAQGWFGRRRFEIPVESILEIDHPRRRIVVARGAVPPEPEGPLQRVLGVGQTRSAAEAAATHPRSPRQTRPVLCGVADDPQRPTVVTFAARLAKALAAPLILAHVTPAHVPPGVSAAPEDRARFRREEHDDVDKLLAALLSRLATGIEIKRVITCGAPGNTREATRG
jgi:hypothetical protein